MWVDGFKASSSKLKEGRGGKDWQVSAQARKLCSLSNV